MYVFEYTIGTFNYKVFFINFAIKQRINIVGYFQAYNI